MEGKEVIKLVEKIFFPQIIILYKKNVGFIEINVKPEAEDA